jgi:hypothetical protein
MAYCPVDCGTDALLPGSEPCELTLRYAGTKRFHFFNCSTSLPDPLDATALETLYTDEAIVMSSELNNVTWNDPTFQEVAISTCRAAVRIVSSREATFQDRIALTVDEGSPAVPNTFYDLAFWADKMPRTLTLNYMVEDCNGDVTIAKDAEGNYLSADLQVWLNEEAASTQGGKVVQFKSGSIIFNGDPKNLFNPPAFNRAPDGDITVY